MSLYNLVHGFNPSAPLVLTMLKLTPEAVPRFRDAWIEVHEGAPRLVVYTRTGGGNRDEYAGSNAAMALVPGYQGDADDDFDSTYANFYYAVPEGFREVVDKLVEIGGNRTEKPAEAWQRVIEEMRSGNVSHQTKQAVEALRPLFDEIVKRVGG